MARSRSPIRRFYRTLRTQSRVTFGARCAYCLFRFLIPTGWTRRVCPAIFRFEDAHCGIKRQPVPIRCMRFEGLRMNLVYHDVDVKVLLVIVGNNHILVVPVSKCVQRVQRAICPLWLRWTFSRWPCQFIMTKSILAAWVQKCNPLHLYCDRVQTGNVVRQHHVSSRKQFPCIGVTFRS